MLFVLISIRLFGRLPPPPLLTLSRSVISISVFIIRSSSSSPGYITSSASKATHENTDKPNNKSRIIYHRWWPCCFTSHLAAETLYLFFRLFNMISKRNRTMLLICMVYYAHDVSPHITCSVLEELSTEKNERMNEVHSCKVIPMLFTIIFNRFAHYASVDYLITQNVVFRCSST